MSSSCEVLCTLLHGTEQLGNGQYLFFGINIEAQEERTDNLKSHLGQRYLDSFSWQTPHVADMTAVSSSECGRRHMLEAICECAYLYACACASLVKDGQNDGKLPTRAERGAPILT